MPERILEGLLLLLSERTTVLADHEGRELRHAVEVMVLLATEEPTWSRERGVQLLPPGPVDQIGSHVLQGPLGLDPQDPVVGLLVVEAMESLCERDLVFRRHVQYTILNSGGVSTRS